MRTIWAILLSTLLLLIYLSLCGAVVVATSGQPTWFEHADGMQVVLGILFVGVISLIVYVLKKIDRNQTLLFERVHDMGSQLDRLQGAHDAIHCMPMGRRATDKTEGHQ